MEYFFQQLVNGLSLGSIYALVALGYTMVYGIIKLINFAHGEIYMIGAYLGYYFINYLKMNVLVGLLLSMIICAFLGALIEFLAYRPLRKSSKLAVLITAIGVSFLLQNLMNYFFTPQYRGYSSPPIEPKTFKVGLISITNIQLYIIVISFILMILLQFVVKKTKMGKAMRAVSVDMDAARLMGINVNRTISFTFMLGSALAAAAGVMIGIYYNSINPAMGFLPGMKAFIAAVLGGIGIIPGAALGGIVIGLIETFVSAMGFTIIKDGAVYAVLIIILLIRPAGILGKNTKEKV